jgi:membrane protease YdiL (CAAX protease family)
MLTDAPSGSRTVARRTQVAWAQIAQFSALAYALSWAWWTPIVWPYLGRVTLTQPLPDELNEVGAGRVALGMFGPLLAAVVMRLLVSREGLKGTLGMRRSWRYYLAALAGPALFVAVVVAVDHVTGLGRFTPPGSLAVLGPTILVVGTAAGVPLTIGEEYGWRGYLLPRLLPLGETSATVILAAIWAGWHLPILLIGLNYPGQPLWAVLPVFAATLALMTFAFTWMYVASGGSVMVVSVMHAALNAASDSFTSPRYIPNGNPLVVGAGGLVGTAMLLVIVAVWGALRPGRPR